MKKTITALLALAMVLCLLPLPVAAADVTLEGNFVKITTAEDFSAGECIDLEPYSVGDGALQLKAGASEGVYVSPVYQTFPWNDLVASWNSDTPRGTSVEIYGRAYIPDYDGWSNGGETYDGWTDWITWGEWSPFIERGCPQDADSHPSRSGDKNGWAYAYSFGSAGDSSLNITDGLTATAFQLKAVVRADGTQTAQPVLRLVAATFKNTNDPDWWSACSLTEGTGEIPDSVLLDTPLMLL